MVALNPAVLIGAISLGIVAFQAFAGKGKADMTEEEIADVVDLLPDLEATPDVGSAIDSDLSRDAEIEGKDTPAWDNRSVYNEWLGYVQQAVFRDFVDIPPMGPGWSALFATRVEEAKAAYKASRAPRELPPTTYTPPVGGTAAADAENRLQQYFITQLQGLRTIYADAGYDISFLAGVTRRAGSSQAETEDQIRGLKEDAKDEADRQNAAVEEESLQGSFDVALQDIRDNLRAAGYGISFLAGAMRQEGWTKAETLDYFRSLQQVIDFNKGQQDAAFAAADADWKGPRMPIVRDLYPMEDVYEGLGEEFWLDEGFSWFPVDGVYEGLGGELGPLPLLPTPDWEFPEPSGRGVFLGQDELVVEPQGRGWALINGEFPEPSGRAWLLGEAERERQEIIKAQAAEEQRMFAEQENQRERQRALELLFAEFEGVEDVVTVHPVGGPWFDYDEGDIDEGFAIVQPWLTSDDSEEDVGGFVPAYREPDVVDYFGDFEAGDVDEGFVFDDGDEFEFDEPWSPPSSPWDYGDWDED